MDKSLSQLLWIGVKYFIIQLLLEIITIDIVTRLGIAYSGLENSGGEPLWEIYIGNAGFYTFNKVLFYSLIYVVLFTVIAYYRKLTSSVAFAILNAFLSLIWIAIILSNRSFSWLLNPLIATVLASAIILIFVLIRRSKASAAQRMGGI